MVERRRPRARRWPFSTCPTERAKTKLAAFSNDMAELRFVANRQPLLYEFKIFLQRVKIVCDRKRGAQCGFAFVTYEDQRDADDAKDECHGKDLDGRAYVLKPFTQKHFTCYFLIKLVVRLRVDYSLTRRAHSPTPGVYKGRRRSSSRDDYDRR